MEGMKNCLLLYGPAIGLPYGFQHLQEFSRILQRCTASLLEDTHSRIVFYLQKRIQIEESGICVSDWVVIKLLSVGCVDPSGDISQAGGGNITSLTVTLTTWRQSSEEPWEPFHP